MKNLTLTICLILAVLLGSAGTSWGDVFPGESSSSRCANGADGSVSCGGQSSRCANGADGSVSCGGEGQ